jgi:4-hydroxyphenylpyruvate dioxygenase-like putative hemolysin
MCNVSFVAECANEPSRANSVHHVVFAVMPEQLPKTVEFFTELGFRFQTIELDDVGLRVLLDWDGGLELVTPLSSDGAGEVAQFLRRNGPGVYSVVIRVGDAPAAEEVAQRYGAQTRFQQHRGGDGFELDEIELSVLGLPLTLLSTDLP